MMTYEEVRTDLGMRNHSGTLKNVVRAIDHAADSVDEAEIGKAHTFRNEVTHEFLGFALESHGAAAALMRFLQKMCERVMARRIGMGPDTLIEPSYNVIYGRVL